MKRSETVKSDADLSRISISSDLDIDNAFVKSDLCIAFS